MYRVRAFSRSLFLLAFIAASLSQPRAVLGQTAPTWNDASGAVRYAAAIDSARKLLRGTLNEHGYAGISAAVAVNGEIVYSEGFGFADVENRVLVTPLTRFRVGSISKPMTADAVALLWEQGRLDLDAPVQKYVPTFPNKGDVITPRMLGGHLSGIRHYKDPGDEFFNTKHYATVTESLEIFENDPLLFKPGTKYSYTSYGFNLLSAVVEAAAGTDFLSYMRKNVFDVLGMRNTIPDYSDSIIPYRTRFYVRPGAKPNYSVKSYHWGDGTPQPLVNAEFTDNSNKWGSGGFLSTPEDLVRFGSAHLQPGFLKAATLTLLFTPQKTSDGKPTNYGLGWTVGTDKQGRRTVRHGGGSVGGTSALLVYPNERVVVAIQANMTNAAFGDVPEKFASLFISSPARTAVRAAGSN
jgi:serine beta-lactamase-like protein LACTB